MSNQFVFYYWMDNFLNLLRQLKNFHQLLLPPAFRKYSSTYYKFSQQTPSIKSIPLSTILLSSQNTSISLRPSKSFMFVNLPLEILIKMVRLSLIQNEMKTKRSKLVSNLLSWSNKIDFQFSSNHIKIPYLNNFVPYKKWIHSFEVK